MGLSSWFGVVGEPLPVDHHARFVSLYPRVMSRGHGGEVARSIIHFFTVVHNDLHPAGNDVAYVGCLAVLRFSDRFYMFGPALSRQECGAADGARLQVNKLELARTTLEGAGLLGRIKALAN